MLNQIYLKSQLYMNPKSKHTLKMFMID